MSVVHIIVQFSFLFLLRTISIHINYQLIADSVNNHLIEMKF